MAPVAVNSLHVLQASELADGAITTSKIVDGAVTASKLASSSVGSGALQELSVTSAALGEAAVVRSKLGVGAVGAMQLGQGAVGAMQLAAGAVTTDRLAERSVGFSALSYELQVRGLLLPATPLVRMDGPRSARDAASRSDPHATADPGSAPPRFRSCCSSWPASSSW